MKRGLSRYVRGGCIIALFLALCAASAEARSWHTVPVPVPVDAAGVFSSGLSGVSCPSASSCEAVGSYDTMVGLRTQAFAERWNGRAWRVQPVPFSMRDVHSSVIGSVTCPSSRFCVAVGARMFLYNGHRWTVHAAPRAGFLNAVSCTSETFCLVVGGSGHRVMSWRWNGHRLVGPDNIEQVADAQVADVSCASTTACTLVGNDFNHYSQSPLAEHWDGHRWTVQKAVYPPHTPLGNAQLHGVSCPSAGTCMAVGMSSIGHRQFRGLTELWDGRRWRLEASPRPDTAAAWVTVSLDSVACPSIRSCITVGATYHSDGKGGNFGSAALAQEWDGVHWHGDAVPGLTSGPDVATADLASVSCTRRWCMAVGEGPSDPSGSSGGASGSSPRPVAAVMG